MKRVLVIVGCAILLDAGLIVTTKVECWSLAWAVGFPLGYTGLFGIMKAIQSRDPKK